MKKIFFLIILIGFFLFVFNFNNTEKENTVRFCSWGSQSEVTILKDVLKTFEDESGVKVEFIHIPQNYFQKLHLLFASNSDLDVIFLNNQYVKTYINANLLLDLSSFVDKDKFFDVSLKAFEDGGKLYAIPRDISNLVLFVNKDILKKRNVEYRSKISTLTELKEYAQKLTFDDVFGINSEENALFWLYYLAANGGGALSDDAKQVIISSKESLEALNLYSNLINKYNIAPTKSQIGSMTTAQMFINGKLSLFLGGRWLVPKFKETINFNWDIIEFPSSKQNKVYIDASGWAISAKSKNIQNSVKLVKYLSSKSVMQKFSESGLITSARKDVACLGNVDFGKSNLKNEKIFITMLESAKPTPVNSNYNKINDILNEEIHKLLSGEKNAEQTFNSKVVKKIEGLL